MSPRSIKQSRVRRVTWAAIALLLAAGFFLSVVPFAPVSAANICTLACCAGRAPHAAGSCMNGTCHTALRVSKRTNKLRLEPESTEAFCGLKSFHTRNLVRTIVPLQEQKHGSPSSTFQPSMLLRPCQLDCGGASGFSSYSPGKAVAVAAADQPRPPTLSRSLTIFGRAHAREIFWHECAPRGPPASFS